MLTVVAIVLAYLAIGLVTVVLLDRADRFHDEGEAFFFFLMWPLAWAMMTYLTGADLLFKAIRRVNRRDR